MELGINKHLYIGFTVALAGLATACDSSTDVAPPNEFIDVFVGSGAQALAIDRGASMQLTVETRDASGTVLQVSPAATFLTRNAAVVAVSQTGVVTGVGGGKTYVIATLSLPSGAPLADSIAITVVP